MTSTDTVTTEAQSIILRTALAALAAEQRGVNVQQVIERFRRPPVAWAGVRIGGVWKTAGSAR